VAFAQLFVEDWEMIAIIWETIKTVLTNFIDSIRGLLFMTDVEKSFREFSTGDGNICTYCGQRRVGIGGYCLRCGHDREPLEAIK